MPSSPLGAPRGTPTARPYSGSSPPGSHATRLRGRWRKLFGCSAKRPPWKARLRASSASSPFASNTRSGDGRPQAPFGAGWGSVLGMTRFDEPPSRQWCRVTRWNPNCGPAFTADEARAALSEWARDMGDVSGFNAYHAWAHRPDVRQRPGRRPLSQGPFWRLFGSFHHAILAAGLAEDARSALTTANGNIRSARYRVSDDQIAEALQEVTKRPRPPAEHVRVHRQARSDIRGEPSTWQSTSVAFLRNDHAPLRALGRRLGRCRTRERIELMASTHPTVKRYPPPDSGSCWR